MRQFGNKIQEFYSLTFEIISIECLHWVLMSLKKDEMTPNEKAIQSRIKEAFGYKISNVIWERLMEDVQKRSINKTKTSTATSVKSSGSSSKGGSTICSQLEMETLQIYIPYLTKQTWKPTEPKKWMSQKSDDWMLTTRTGKKLGYLPNQTSTKQFYFHIVEEMPSIDKMIGQDKVLLIYPTNEWK